MKYKYAQCLIATVWWIGRFIPGKCYAIQAHGSEYTWFDLDGEDKFYFVTLKGNTLCFKLTNDINEPFINQFYEIY